MYSYSKENSYSETYENLLKNFRNIVQSELELIYMNKILGEKNKGLSDYLAEITTLRGIIPICANCKKIRDNEGFWTQVEKYIEDRSEAEFTHGLCGECTDELYGNQPWYQKRKTSHNKNIPPTIPAFLRHSGMQNLTLLRG